jgi:hypothetical protein
VQIIVIKRKEETIEFRYLQTLTYNLEEILLGLSMKMDRPLLRMDVNPSNLHQCHWRHYSNPYLVDALNIYPADRKEE